MDATPLLQAIALGVIEGFTEFLPISSTGHLILAERLLGFEEGGRAFKIVIQLGAILAVVVVFWARLWGIVLGLPRDRAAQLYARNIAIAVLPALVLGATLYRQVQAMLGDPWIVCAALIAGGIVIILVDRLGAQARIHAVEAIPLPAALVIGAAQAVAMIPGTSRSAATIIGAMAMGVDRKTAAEFSFVLAIPTMIAATAYSLYKEWATLDWQGFWLIAVGFVVSFVVALLVVRAVLALIAHIGWAPFGWYRIGVGLVMLAVLAAGG
jgi:undecaprenyl-diphosphatase